jgi:hypothetical protein
MAQVDNGPWITCHPSPTLPDLYTAAWSPDLLDDARGSADHQLRVFVSDSSGRSRSLVQGFCIDMENLGKWAKTSNCRYLNFGVPVLISKLSNFISRVSENRVLFPYRFRCRV